MKVSIRKSAALGALALSVALWLALAADPVRAQGDIEDESITEQGTLDPFTAEDRDLQSIFDEAERLFRTFEQPDSVPLFDRLIARLESDRARGPLPDDLRTMLIRSRAHRAETHFNLGESDKAAEDLRSILLMEPGWQIDPDLVSPKLVEVVERLRREMVGEILVLVEPIDATVTLGGSPIEFVGQPTAVLTGSQPLVITRAGYAPVEEEVEIRAGRSTTVDHTLDRLSAVARLRVRPAGATVLVDGEPAQVAARTEIDGASPEEDLAIEGLIPGQHVVELRLDAYRPYRVSFEALELEDYRLPPAALELMQGEVRLAGLPAGATVAVAGQPAEPGHADDGSASLRLAPGDYLIEIHKPGVGGFRAQISVGDQEIARLVVDLKPTIAYLGVLGSDRLAASDLSERLATRFLRLSEWLWSDHSIEAPAVLDAAGLNAVELRRLSMLANRRAAPDWSEIQGNFDEVFPSSLYLLAVLGDDLYATSADLWLWSPAPWPATPGTRTIPLQGDDEALERLAAAFDSRIVPSYLRFGARFIEANGLTVSTVMDGGPAAAAGLTLGDRVLAAAGAPVSTLSELRERAGAAGGELALRVGTEASPREIRLQVDLRPGVLALSDTGVVDQVLAARLSLELLSGESEIPFWLLQLNQAALYLRAMAYQAAVPLLRTIEAPTGAGLSRAMVDYWLGSTLMSVDARVYADAARQALESALAQEGARLYHADGPVLAPRVRARLAELERALGN